MKRLFIILLFGALLGGGNAQALTFGIQTQGATVQSRVDEFTTARKAYEQLKTQGADDAMLVIQGRVVLEAMLNVFEVALNNHEKQFDALKAGGVTNEAVYSDHKARITRARTWIAEQRDLVKSAETREELRNRAAAFRKEWKAFRKEAWSARSSILIERAETFLQKAEAMESKLEGIRAKVSELPLASIALDEAITVMDSHIAAARTALEDAETNFDTLEKSADDDAEAAYRSVMSSLANFRSSLELAREGLATFRTLARKLGQ